MKKTFLFEVHQKLSAKIVPFAGFMMPLEYSGIIDEHKTVRNAAGLFDVSHMGEFWVKGEKALEFLQKVTTNDVDLLAPGQIQYSCFPNGKGGIVDDLLVYCYEKNKYMLVVNASNIEKDWNWLNKNIIGGVSLENASDNISQVALQGPKSQEILQKLVSIDLSTLPYFHFTTTAVAGIPDVILSRTGYTGEKGYELYCYNADVEALWQKIMEAGKDFGIKPIGLAARDTLRLEAGLCLYGNDIDDTTSPIEAGLSWIVKFNKAGDFIDKDFLLKQKQQGQAKLLRGIELTERGIPRKDYELCDESQKVIGRVTSGTMSPSSGKALGMAYVDMAYSKPDTKVFVNIRNKMIAARVVKLPFVNNTK